MNLAQLRDQWEIGKTVIAEFGVPARDRALVVVCKRFEPQGLGLYQYYVFRYFALGPSIDNWVISCDAQKCVADEAFAAAAKGVEIMLG